MKLASVKSSTVYHVIRAIKYTDGEPDKLVTCCGRPPRDGGYVGNTAHIKKSQCTQYNICTHCINVGADVMDSKGKILIKKYGEDPERMEDSTQIVTTIDELAYLKGHYRREYKK